MYEVLKALGFDVTHYLARVVNNTDNMPPQTHRFTVLDYENERYIVDVGIGFRSPSVPVKFGNDASISHLGVEYKVVELEKNLFGMQLMEKGKPFIVTKFDLTPCYKADFEMGHFYSYKNPNAVFINTLVVSLIEEDVIHSVVNSRYFKISAHETQEETIKSVKQLEELLKNTLNCSFSSQEVTSFYEKYIK